ncbi:MAG: hypothetical protein ACR2PX_17260 [Endozoicomonas sp.]|uniref:hypothetical protein n=1 Tax=Endozoicomonas sp. TaxID=1892382 RepID=UPI003D9AE21A
MSDLLNGEGRKSDLINQGFVPDIFFSDPHSVYATFSPDGQQILITYSNGVVKIWNTQEALSNLDSMEMKYTRRTVLAKPVMTIDHRSNDVIYHAAYSHDGENVLTCSRDRTARLWNVKGLLAGENTERVVYQHESQVVRCAFRQDNKLVLTHSFAKGQGFDPYYNPASRFTSNLWLTPKPSSLPVETDETDESSSMTAPVQTTPLTSLKNVRSVLSPGGQFIMGYAGDSVSLWRFSELLQLKGNLTPLKSIWHGGEVRHSTFNRSGSLIVSSSNDHTFKVLLRDSTENKVVRLAKLEVNLSNLNQTQQAQTDKLRALEQKLSDLTQSAASGGGVMLPSVIVVLIAIVMATVAP